MFQFYLNNTLVKDALNWIDFEEVIERDDSIKGLLPKYDVKLRFGSDGYNALYDLFLDNGFCNLVELIVKQKCGSGYDTVLNGLIFLSDCTFNLNKCEVDCSVFDNNYAAKIFNNKNIKTYLDTTLSKNGETITAASYEAVKFYTPTTGVYSNDTRRVYKLHDTFRFLIDFMTDGEVGFESNYLQTFIINGSTTGITTGEEIRLHNDNVPYISFQMLFEELNKKFPLGFTIINVAGVPTIKIEQSSYFYKNTTSININNIEDLNLSFDNELLYSTVKFGESTSYDAAINSFGEVQFLSFKEEEYHLQGKCNIDKQLDLTAEFVSNTNAIEELVATNISNDSYDDEIFFIQYEQGSINFATQNVNPTSQGLPYFYNGNLTNNEVAERYELAGNIAIYLGTNQVGFKATKTNGSYTFVPDQQDVAALVPPAIQTSTPVQVAFNDDSTGGNYDAGGNYNNTTYRYTSPQSGNYAFDATVIFNVPSAPLSYPLGTNRYYRIWLEIRKYNSSNVLIQTISQAYPNTTGFYSANFANYFLTISGTLYLAATDYAVVYAYHESKPVNFLIESFLRLQITNASSFETTATTTGGGIYKPTSINDYYVSKLTFDKAISNADYNTMKLDLSQALVVDNGSGENRTAWIRKTRRKLATGEMSFELISNLDNIN